MFERGWRSICEVGCDPHFLIQDCKMFQKARRRKLLPTPLDEELLSRINRTLAHAKHFLPPKSGNDPLGLTGLIHPSRPRLDEQMPSVTHIVLKCCRFVFSHHQWVGQE